MRKNPSEFENTKRPLSTPGLSGTFTFLFFIILGLFILWQRYQILKETEQREMSNLISYIENNIDNTLKDSYNAALSLALLVESNGSISGFDEVAPQLVLENPVIDAVQMVPGGIISQVHPIQGNQSALDYNILEDPNVKDEALRAISDRKMYFAGPLELRQGGLAVIGRLPVFIKKRFLGFCSGNHKTGDAA